MSTKRARKTAKKVARKRGGQTTYTKTKADEVIDRLSGGKSLRQICRAKHLPPVPTVINWVMDDRHGFADRYARAREVQCDGLFDQLHGDFDWITLKYLFLVSYF